MRSGNQSKNWNSESCLSKDEETSMQFKSDHEDQTKDSGMLCHTHSNIQFRMMDNIQEHEKEN